MFHTVDSLEAGRAFHHLTYLAGLGPRVAGSTTELEAAIYIADYYRELGMPTTVFEFPVPVWHPHGASLQAGDDAVPCISAIFGGTGTVSGDLVFVGAGSEHDLVGKPIAGNVVLVARDVYVDYPDYEIADRLHPLEPAGIIYTAGPGHLGLPQAYYNFKRSLKEWTPPTVIVSYQDALRLLHRRPTVVRLSAGGDVTWSVSRSVIADLPGVSEEVVLLGAHNDSTPTSPGAADDAGGVVNVMEIARVLAVAGRPQRTLRFVTWGGHELGLMGSEDYLRQHEGDRERVVACINYDGQGHLMGDNFASVLGSDVWVDFVRRTMDEVGADVSIEVAMSGTDLANFSAAGIQGVNLGRGWGVGNHTPHDNLLHCGPDGLMPGLIMGAALAERTASAPSDLLDTPIPAERLAWVIQGCAKWGWGIRPESNRF